MNQNFRSTKAESNFAMCLGEEIAREALSSYLQTQAVFVQKNVTSETVKVSENRTECAVEIKGIATGIFPDGEYRAHHFEAVVILDLIWVTYLYQKRKWYPRSITLTLPSLNLRIRLDRKADKEAKLISVRDRSEAAERVEKDINSPEAPWKILAVPADAL